VSRALSAAIPGDLWVIAGAAGLRAAAVSMAGVLIAIHLAVQGLSATEIGVVLSAGVAASATATIVVGLRADVWGRRRTLVLIGLMSAIGYAAMSAVSGLGSILAVAVLGLVNGMGRDRGPASTLEQAVIPGVVSMERRTWAMAWYNAAIDVGHAIGALGAIIPTVVERTALPVSGHAAAFALCGLLVGISALGYVALGEGIEASPGSMAQPGAAIDPASRRIVHRLAALFALDSVGGGFLGASLVAYWFFERYGTSEVQLAALFFAARVLNVVSHLVAAWLARRIGLLNTMVWTHLPSSVLLMLAPAAPGAALAAALFLAREALVEMDVPTRQSYVMAVVPPSARTYASGVTNVTRNLGWGVGPLIGGAVMQHLSLAGPLFIGGALKIAYDLMLYRSFRAIRPPEER
jgi:predicted MFS family arabinose efflux permease